MGIWQELDFLTVKEKIPLTAVWELTHDCFLNCVHCYVNSCGKIPDFKKIQCVVSRLEKAGTMFVTLTGGDPALHPDFSDTVTLLRKKGFGVSVFTTGASALKYAEFLGKAGIIECSVSLYADSSVIHDCITGCSGSFDETVSALKLLKDYNIRTVVKFVGMKQNIHTMKQVERLAEKMHAIFQPDFIVTGKNAVFGKGFIGVSEAIKKIHDRGMRIACGIPGECGAGKNFMGISPDGSVWSCLQFCVSAGNIYKQDISQMRFILPADACKNRESMQYLTQEEKKIISLCPALLYKYLTGNGKLYE